MIALLAALGAAGLAACEDDPLAPWLQEPPGFLTVIGKFGEQDGGFYYPSGIAADLDGNILVTDTNYPRLQTFSPDGAFLRRVELEGQSTPSYLTDIEVAPDGTVFIASLRGGLRRFDRDGHLLGELGPVEEFGLARDRSGNIWAARTWGEYLEPGRSRRHPCIVRFTPDGAVADSIGLPTYISGYDADPESSGWSPGNLAVSPEGDFYAAGRDDIWKVTRDGKRSQEPFYSSPAREDGARRSFEEMTVDEEGFLYVVDSVFDQILKIDPRGRLVCVWGEEIPDQNPLHKPLGICIDPAGDIYVTDSWKHRVVKYGYREP